MNKLEKRAIIHAAMAATAIRNKSKKALEIIVDMAAKNTIKNHVSFIEMASSALWKLK